MYLWTCASFPLESQFASDGKLQEKKEEIRLGSFVFSHTIKAVEGFSIRKEAEKKAKAMKAARRVLGPEKCFRDTGMVLSVEEQEVKEEVGDTYQILATLAELAAQICTIAYNCKAFKSDRFQQCSLC